MSLFLNFLIEGWCQIINTRSEAFNTRSKASENRVFDMWYVTYDVLCLIIIWIFKLYNMNYYWNIKKKFNIQEQKTKAKLSKTRLSKPETEFPTPEAKLLKKEICAYRIGFDNLEKVKVKFLSANGRCVFY